jgi:CheY-like chemotaxis protein/anti-sigma regulatory factor (Ser/Thr protein kinase)
MSHDRPTVLVVEDNPADVLLVREALREAGFEAAIETAGDGREALDRIEGGGHPDVVLTDLHMPRLDGLRLVEEVRRRFPSIPVVLMTAFGSEAIAFESLRKGAASYVPKTEIPGNLAATLHQVIEVSGAARRDEILRPLVAEVTTTWMLGNDVALVGPLVQALGAEYRRLLGADETAQFRLSIALHEALTNAMFHGNLELSSTLRREDGSGESFMRVADDRRGAEPWGSRHVRVVARLTPDLAAYSVRDDGPGFDTTLLPDPRDPANVETVGGRGLFLIHLFMDEVRHNERGNEITMVKRRGGRPEGT